MAFAPLRLEADGFLTVRNIFLQSAPPPSGASALLSTLEGEAVFRFKGIPYYRLITSSGESHVRVRLELRQVISETNFLFTAHVGPKHENKLEYPVRSRTDYENLIQRFMSDFKLLYPLRGTVMERRGLIVTANLGKNYGVKKDDLFFVLENGLPAGLVMADAVENRHSRFYVTSFNSEIKTDAVMVPFTYEMNQQYRLESGITPYKLIRDEMILQGLYGNDFKVFFSSGRYLMVSDEKETGLFDFSNNSYERTEQRNFNEMAEGRFSRDEKYAGFLFRDGLLRIMELGERKKLLLKLDTENSNYHLIPEKEEPLHPYEDPRVSCFTFAGEDTLIFFDAKQNALVTIRIGTDRMKKEVWAGPAAPRRMDITPNNRILVLKGEEGLLHLFDLEDGRSFSVKTGGAGYALTRTGAHLAYEKDQAVRYLNLYSGAETTHAASGPFTRFLLSFSERRIFFYRRSQLDLYDLKWGIRETDVFSRNRPKSLERVDPLFDDSALLYGKLFDQDNNNRLDYRDLNVLLALDPEKGALPKIKSAVDGYYGLGNYNRYMVFRKNRSLVIKNIAHENQDRQR